MRSQQMINSACFHSLCSCFVWPASVVGQNLRFNCFKSANLESILLNFLIEKYRRFPRHNICKNKNPRSKFAINVYQKAISPLHCKVACEKDYCTPWETTNGWQVNKKQSEKHPGRQFEKVCANKQQHRFLVVKIFRRATNLLPFFGRPNGQKWEFFEDPFERLNSWNICNDDVGFEARKQRENELEE
jgi:hypothetical protein